MNRASGIEQIVARRRLFGGGLGIMVESLVASRRLIKFS